MGFETLEQRRLLAGDVTAVLEDGRLIVRGDEAANALVITRDEGDRDALRLVPQSGTTVNGSADPLVVEGVLWGIDVQLGGGDDELQVLIARVRRHITIDGGDRILVRGTRTSGDLTLLGGAGDDTIEVRKGITQGHLTLDGQAGNDTTTVLWQDVLNDLAVEDVVGASGVAVGNTRVEGVTRIVTGAAADDVSLDFNRFSGGALVDTAGGPDRLQVVRTAVRGEETITAGDGDDDEERDLTLTWDFRTGPKAG
ncbi:MAG: hypothetical protein ACFCVE_04080 [Phycisphaerae bacterium]